MPASKLVVIHRGTSARRSKSTISTRTSNCRQLLATETQTLRSSKYTYRYDNFFLFSLQVLRQSQHIAHNVRHSDFRHFHCWHFEISTFWLRHCDCRHFQCRHFDSVPIKLGRVEKLCELTENAWDLAGLTFKFVIKSFQWLKNLLFLHR